MGEFNVLVGINLLREGLDLPEVSLVAVIDANKEGFNFKIPIIQDSFSFTNCVMAFFRNYLYESVSKL